MKKIIFKETQADLRDWLYFQDSIEKDLKKGSMGMARECIEGMEKVQKDFYDHTGLQLWQFLKLMETYNAAVNDKNEIIERFKK